MENQLREIYLSGEGFVLKKYEKEINENGCPCPLCEDENRNKEDCLRGSKFKSALLIKNIQNLKVLSLEDFLLKKRTQSKDSLLSSCEENNGQFKRYHCKIYIYSYCMIMHTYISDNFDNDISNYCHEIVITYVWQNDKLLSFIGSMFAETTKESIKKITSYSKKLDENNILGKLKYYKMKEVKEQIMLSYSAKNAYNKKEICTDFHEIFNIYFKIFPEKINFIPDNLNIYINDLWSDILNNKKILEYIINKIY